MRLPITRSSITALYSVLDPFLRLAPAARLVFLAMAFGLSFGGQQIGACKGVPHRVRERLARMAILQPGKPELDQARARPRGAGLLEHLVSLVLELRVIELARRIAERGRHAPAVELAARADLDVGRKARWKIRKQSLVRHDRNLVGEGERVLNRARALDVAEAFAPEGREPELVGGADDGGGAQARFGLGRDHA